MWSAVQRGFVRHDEATFVADGLRNGFKLGVDTTKMRGHRQFNNYKSSIEAAASVSRAVQERVDIHKTIDLGPSTPGLEQAIRQYFVSSCIFPMGAVGKSVEEYADEKRPTDDHTRTGLNAATDMKGLRYGLDTYREIAEGFKKYYFMRVSDVKGAFPILPIHPEVWPFFFFRFFKDGNLQARHLYLHIFADFGAAGTPGTFKIFFDVVISMARSAEVLTLPMSVYVDDLQLFGPERARVDVEMEQFHQFGETCGVFFKWLKDRKAAQCQLALGFWWDSRTLTRCLVQEKVDAYMFTFGEVLTCKTLSLLDMQKAAGKMQRSVMTFPRGAACLVVSMFALMCGLRLPWHRRRTTRTVRQDVRTVIDLLRLNLGKGYYSFSDFVLGPAVATDASRARSYTGGGWFSFCGLYDFWIYGSRAARKGIDFLEGDVIIVAVQRMAHRWFGRRIPFFVDNMVFEKSGEAGRSRVERLNVLLKELFMLQIVYNFIIEWFWIDTNSNKLADHLSRGREDGFLRDAHGGGTERWDSEFNRVADDPSRAFGGGSRNVAPDALRFVAEYLTHFSETTELAYAGKALRKALPVSWLCLPAGITPRRIDAEVGRTRVLPEVRGQITERMLSEAHGSSGGAACKAAPISVGESPANDPNDRYDKGAPDFQADYPLAQDLPGIAGSNPGGSALLLRAMQTQPPDVDGVQGATYAQRAIQAAGGGVRGRGGKAIMTLLLLSFCSGGESARPERGRDGVAEAVAASSYSRSSIFDGLPADVLPQVERMMDNRLSSSSWQKINTALRSWREFAASRGWPTVIETDDPLRGGKLAAWVTSLVALTTLVYASISKYVWGLCTWMTLQHQADPRVAVPEWRTFMAATKVLTFVPAKPHDRWTVENLEKVLVILDPTKFEDIQLAVLLLLLFYTFARSETPLSKTRGGRDCFDPKEDLTWSDVRLRRDRSTQYRQIVEVRFKKVKTDQRMERAEARGDGDWRPVGAVDDPLWDLPTWYVRLLGFYGRKRGDSEPFFIDPSLCPANVTAGEVWMHRDAEPSEAWLYRDALTASYAAQRAAGVPDSELAAFHGLRVEGYNLSKRGNGVAITGAHGGWTSRSGRKRYDRFGPRSAHRISQNMLRARVSDFSASSEDDESGDSEDAEPPERAAAPPASRIDRSQLQSPGAGSSSSPVAAPLVRPQPVGGATQNPLLPEGWTEKRREAPSGTRYTTYVGPHGEKASSRVAAWAVFESVVSCEATPASGASASAAPVAAPLSARKQKKKKPPAAGSSGPIPPGLELGNFVTFAARPSARKAPAARNT